MTKARKAVLEVLRTAERPLSASEISSLVSHCCDPVTIYRTLHYLEDKGLADSFVLHCTEHGTERYFTLLAPGEASFAHHNWFHCEHCHQFIDLGDCRIGTLVDAYQEELGIRVTGHTLYLTGVCPACSSVGGNGQEHDHRGHKSQSE
ncbi:MAG: transcriptional repressor [Sphaerochaeta sp.]|nr:transcriptional repressor [Sphaerochaeta sp.]